jgi:hypothetical protein
MCLWLWLFSSPPAFAPWTPYLKLTISHRIR